MSIKSLFAFSLLLSVSAITGMTSIASASEIEIPFTGSVAPTCEFVGKPTAGLLAANSSTLPTQLSSANKGGSSGQVLVKCNTSAAVSAADYKQTSGQDFKISEAKYTLSSGTQEGQTVKVSMGETPINVNLMVSSKEPIPAGDYGYNVYVTAAP
jgi:hypothetical protein